MIQLIHELDPAAAQVMLERAREIDPSSPYLNQNFALLAMFRGNAREARDHWVRQIELVPTTQ